MDKYDVLREGITVPMVVERYIPGARIRNRRIPCPFHGGEHRNLALTDRVWYCHVCHAGGDVIEFVRRYFSLRFPETVLRLSADFGIKVCGQRASPAHEAKMQRELMAMQRRREEAISFSDRQVDALSKLRLWLNDTAAEDAQSVIDDIDALLDRHLKTGDLFSWDVTPMIQTIKEKYEVLDDDNGDDDAPAVDA